MKNIISIYLFPIIILLIGIGIGLLISYWIW